ncbi:site-specific DNA-methyltransferase [Streptococcus sp. zg-JUN1979]|uniref:site-specific DNA-methyltransferase n=1 Tax=Streptococcus sp. zg-JUN1979 TaxID=3391450 RepID=UPI0039A74900
MLKHNLDHNTQVTSTTSFLQTLKDRLPEFFTADKYDEEGELVLPGEFDFEKFKTALNENNIQTELTSGYQMNFIGKNYAKKQAGEAPTTVVLPDKIHNEKPENKDSQNLFFTGDNLEVLRHLQAGYENSIDVIYIDPPYNTGSDGFVYPDKFEYSDDKLQSMFGMTDDELKRLKSIQGRATHSAWLTFMYPRLWLAKRLLKETGVIFVSIDDNEQANLKLLMDEIFGEENFVANFVWTKKEKTSGVPPVNLILPNKEHILCYKKHDIVKFKGQKRSLKSYRQDENGRWWRLMPIQATGNQNSRFNIVDPLTGRKFYGNWAFSEDTIKQMIKKGRIAFPKNDNGLPTQIVYADELKNGTPIFENLGLFESEVATKSLIKLLGNKLFDFPKPDTLIKFLLDQVTVTDSLILDFFAGSATTADAVMQLNAKDGGKRKYIMVQLPEPTFTQNSDGTKVACKGSKSAFEAGYMSIDEISRERITRASQKIKDEKGSDLPAPFDLGFKHYRVLEPSQATLDDLEHFDIETGAFIDSKGNQILLNESGFDDMISPFSSKGLGFGEGSSGEETILTTWLLADGYSILSPVTALNLDGYQASYINSERLYLIAEGWSSKQTKQLVNIIGNNEKVIQTIVLYGYSFEMESMQELELALKQLDTKVNLVKRY